jgi:hypothetical protein
VNDDIFAGHYKVGAGLPTIPAHRIGTTPADLTLTIIGADGPPARPVCADHDPDLWQAPHTVDQAKALCATCPALGWCRDRSADEPEGVWAGMTPDERPAARRRVQRAAQKARARERAKDTADA